MKQVTKKIVLLILVLTLIVPSNVMAYIGPTSIQPVEAKVETQKLSQELLIEEGNASDLIRIVVELNDMPVIDYATQEGIQVSELETSFVESKTEQLLETQDAVINTLDKKIKVNDVHEQFTTIFNGFSTTILRGDLKVLAKDNRIKAITESNIYSRPVTEMINSSLYTEHKYVNEVYGLTGENMVVAIIDTGIDPSHRDFVIDEDKSVDLTSEDVNQLITENGLLGKYYTEKVPYGYNYMDGNSEIRDLGVEASMHGMHVAGTVAANGDIDNGGIKGVAPNAQVLALKVFGNDPQYPSTFGDIIIKAIDDAIILGADVMNLSLGSTAAFVDEEDPEQQAVERAVDNGILMSISAGNSGRFGSGFYLPYAENPDIGVVGAPGIASDSLQVASINNASILFKSTLTIEGMDINLFGYGADEWPTNKEFTLVPIGGSKLGLPEDYAGIDVKGKVVLVKRGSLTFMDKTKNAALAGAIGIIVYNNGGTTFYKDQGNWEIPFMKVSTEDGLKLEALLAKMGGQTKIAVSYGQNGVYLNPVSGLISDFSSYGTTPSLDIKPEIAAPGGNIYSTFNNNTYGYMSGTSMAAPHVSGGATLVLERIMKDPIFTALNLTAEEKVVLAKNILMNTATPVMDANKYTYASPRVQGAGSMNLRYAMKTDVVVTDSTTGVAKVNLGETNSDVLEFTVTVKNYGDDTAIYEPAASAQAMYCEDGINYMIPVELFYDAEYFIEGEEVDGVFAVAGKQTVDLDVEITISPDDFAWLQATNPAGFFIEGYLTLYTDDAILGEVINNKIAEYNAKKAEVAAKKEEIALQKAAIESLTETKVPYVNQLNGTEATDGIPAVVGLLAQLATLQASLADYQEQLDGIEQQTQLLAEVTKTYDDLAFNFALLVGDKASVEEILSYITAYEAELAKANNQQADNEKLIATLRLELLNASHHEARRIEKKIKELEQCNVCLDEKIEKLQQAIDNLGVAKDDLLLYLSVYNKIKADVASAKEDVDSEYAQLQLLKKAIAPGSETISDEIATLKTEIDGINKSLAEIDEKVDFEKEKLTTLEKELMALENQLITCENNVNEAIQTYYAALPLSIPYITFSGDWSDPKAFDVSIYDHLTLDAEGNLLKSFYEETSLINIIDVTEAGTRFYNLGFKDGYYYGEYVGISPNQDGYKDDVTPRISLLRNIKEMKCMIQDAEGNTVRVLGMYPEVRKNYFDGGRGISSYLLSEYTWDAKVNNNLVADGQYYYVVEGVLADNATKQSISMPIYIDTVAPAIQTVEYKNGDAQLKVAATDSGMGIANYYLVDATTQTILVESQTPVFDLTPLKGDVYVTYTIVEDYAGNSSTQAGLTVLNDEAIPEVRMDLEPFSVKDTRTFVVNGQVYEIFAPEVSIDGNEVLLEEDGSFVYDASYTSDGKKSLHVAAIDGAGNTIEFDRHFYIDSIAPEIQLPSKDGFDDSLVNDNIVYVKNDVTTYDIKALISDNFPDLRVELNGNVLVNKSVDYISYASKLLPSSYELNEKVSLKEGYNTYVINAYDTTGKSSTQTVVVHRAIQGEVDPGTLANTVEILNTPGIELFVGETLELNYTAILNNGSSVVNSPLALITANSNAVSITGRTIKADIAGDVTITVKVNDVTDTYILKVKNRPTPPIFVNPGSTTAPSSTVETVIEEEEIAQSGISLVPGSFIKGYTNGTFKPEAYITRAEISQIMAKILTLKSVTTTSFKDVQKGFWAQESIATVESAKLFKGYQGKFMPQDYITRSQLASVLARTLDLIGEKVVLKDTPYSDITTHWAKADIQKIYSYGIVLDKNATSFLPDAKMTRSEVIVMINQLMKVDVTTAQTEQIFSDVDASHWAYKNIQAAAQKK